MTRAGAAALDRQVTSRPSGREAVVGGAVQQMIDWVS
jgi:hypothetical protein